MLEPARPEASRLEARLGILVLAVALLFNAWAVGVGWTSKNLPGVEFRQAQTALSSFFIQQDRDFSIAYPTPVLGKPWAVPMEFPLYEWTVVAVSDVTGLAITKSGRAVSIACLYLSLPALFLILGQWGVAPGRRWVAAALMLTCPLYIFYGRAVLIETMALMFALWFWAALVRAVAGRSGFWLAVAMVAGVGGGLTKVTTFLVYLVPLGWWCGVRLWRGRRWGDLGWMAAAAALPCAAAWWWVVESDRIKALNPMAAFLLSGNLTDFNLGTWAAHLSGLLWAMKWRIISQELTWLPVLVAVAVALVAPANPRRGPAVLCVATFAVPVCLFPILYAYHDYYYVANTAALWLAVSLLAAGWMESPRWRAAGWVLAGFALSGQVYWYLAHDYPVQRQISNGGSGLTEALRGFTRPDDVIVIAGEDWDSIIPYYARRRALMFREPVEKDLAAVDAAFAALAGERIGAFVVTGTWQARSEILWRLAERGLAIQPWLHWHGTWVFLREDERPAFLRQLPAMCYDHVLPGEPAAIAAGKIAGGWHQVSTLPPEQRRKLKLIRPEPVRYYNTFDPVLEENGPNLAFGAHPTTRLVFHLPAGPHTLRTEVIFNAGAYNVPPGQDRTDGVEVELNEVDRDETRHAIFRRLVDPTGHPEDRQSVPIVVPFSLAAAGDVEVVFGPGPKNDFSRDWIYVRQSLVIE